LHERLGNEPETELAVVGQQLREIALLRLEGRVAQ
jgi:2-oxo-4-hydroxy-4-carboxy--5-ureidoimidazoline (OHCU) decarboxylase